MRIGSWPLNQEHFLRMEIVIANACRIICESVDSLSFSFPFRWKNDCVHAIKKRFDKVCAFEITFSVSSEGLISF